jgi:hypothetical protein
MTRRILFLVGGITLACVGLVALRPQTVLWAQSAVQEPSGSSNTGGSIRIPAMHQPPVPKPAGSLIWKSEPRDSSDPRRDLWAQISQAKQEVGKAEAEGREQAVTRLKELLNAYFVQDMEVRRQELEEIKKRVTELESYLQRRQAAKGDIIELQAKVLVNEADGLGFFTSPVSPEEARDDLSPSLFRRSSAK